MSAESALLIATLVMLTGALHLDGLADTFDGLFGGRDRASRLRIMHDVTTGAFGAVAITMTLLMQTLALASIPTGSGRTSALLFAPVSARCAMVFAIAAFPYARPSGLGSLMHDRGKVPTAVAGVAALTLAVALFGPWGPMLLVPVIATVGAITFWSYRSVGGLTGDVYGAVCELSFAASLLAVSAAAEQSWLEPTRVLRP